MELSHTAKLVWGICLCLWKFHVKLGFHSLKYIYALQESFGQKTFAVTLGVNSILAAQKDVLSNSA